MRKIRDLRKIIASAAVIVIMFSTSGCSKKEEKPEAKQQAVQDADAQQKKSVEQLKNMEKNIESIIRELDGPAAAMEQGGQGNQAGGGAQQAGGGGQQGQQGQQAGGGAQQGQQVLQEQHIAKWSRITSIIHNLHYQWNSYMPQAVKTGADMKLVNSFGSALNGLTGTAMTKNRENTLMAASNLYAHMPDFYSLYRTGTSPPEIKRIRHYTRSAMLNSMVANWAQADYDISCLKSSWSLFKNTLPKEQEESINMLDFSIYELEQVIRERNQPLADIKGRVAMSNIQALEKSLEE